MDRPLPQTPPLSDRVRLGATGWRQPDWMGAFYPVDSEQGRLLSLYSRRFSFVEASQCEEGFPSAKRMRRWVRDTPAEFRFALPVPRRYTHDMRLDLPPDHALDHLGQVSHWLSGKLAFFRLGLPPDFTPVDLARLDRFLKAASAPDSPCPARWIVVDPGETGLEFGRPGTRDSFGDGAALIETVLHRGASLAVDDRMLRPSPILMASPVPCINLLSGEDRLDEMDRAARRLDGAPGFRRALPGFEQDLRLQRWAAIIQRLQGRPRSDAPGSEGSPPSPVHVLVDDGYEGHAPSTLAKLAAYLQSGGADTPAAPSSRSRHLRLVA